MPAYVDPALDDGTLDHFEPALQRLINELPAHLQGAIDPAAELRKWLTALAEQIDDLSAKAEQVYTDARLATASRDGLIAEWVLVYGLGNEIANLTTEQLRGYIEQWIACDGTTQSILNLLTAIINLNPANNGGPLLTFDAGGAGLTFDAGGAGVGPLYQYATKPDQTVGFVFPGDGSGLTFPDQALYFPVDGSGLTFGLTFPNVPDLTFPNNAWVVITEAFSSYALAVTAKSYLAFNRPAFLRAINRFSQAHVAPVTYSEVNT